jgi:hypothetical protein
MGLGSDVRLRGTKCKIRTVLLLVKILDSVAGLLILAKLGLVLRLVELRALIPDFSLQDVNYLRIRTRFDPECEGATVPLSTASEMASKSSGMRMVNLEGEDAGKVGGK